MTDQIPDQGFRVSSWDGVPVVTAPDEIDAANAEALGDALEAASADHPTIIVDMTRNVFCDSSGLRVLIVAVKRARAAGGELRLVLSQPHLRRVFKVTGSRPGDQGIRHPRRGGRGCPADRPRDASRNCLPSAAQASQVRWRVTTKPTQINTAA